MKRSDGFLIDPSWKLMMNDLGVPVQHVLRQAALPEDLFARDERLTTDQFFRFWGAVEKTVDSPLFPLHVTQATTADTFSPCLFAVLCSPNLVVGLERLATYKRLVAPLKIELSSSPGRFTVTFEWTDATEPAPASLVAMELTYFVHVARMATRHPVVPIEVTAPDPPTPASVYQAFFQIPVSEGETLSVTFSEVDATRPFLTANAGMWSIFEADLKRRLAELDRSATTAERVRAVLLEGIPSARFSMEDVCRRMAMSRRTLQRRLKGEGTTFQAILSGTREKLARHYLKRTDLTSSEIGFLLGFEETSSFFRAFHAWTGQTPEASRRSASSGPVP